MKYGEIITVLFIVLIIHYVIMIVQDTLKARAQAAGAEEHTEEDIDISDEAGTFRPVRISRERPAIVREGTAGLFPEENQPAGGGGRSGKPLPPNYREAIMTDGILAENIISEVNRYAETGVWDLGAVIFSCENAA